MAQGKKQEKASARFVQGKKKAVSAKIHCIRKGTAVVTAKAVLKNGKTRTYKCKIKVKDPSVSVRAKAAELAVGETTELNVRQTPGKKQATVKFKSGDEKVVQVSKSGKLIAVAAGKTKITATLTCGTVVKKDRVEITVTDPSREVREAPAQAVSVMDVDCAAAGMAAMTDGTLLVTDVYNKVVWQVKGGVSTVYAGADTVKGAYGEPLGGYVDSTRGESCFSRPYAIVPFLDGWAVSDTENHALRLLTKDAVQTINAREEGKSAADGKGVSFEQPTGLAADDKGNLYVADTGSGVVRQITTEGVVGTVASDLNNPTGLCWKNGVLYIAETGANRIVKLTGGKVETVAGSGEDGYADGAVGTAAFSAPQAVVAADDGTLYVADTCNSAIRIIKNGNVTTLLLRDKAGLEMAPMSPTGLFMKGNELYICDSFSRKVLKVVRD